MEENAQFANNVLNVRSYTQCVAIAQAHLREIASKHGALKQWCIEKGIDYKSAIKIKNGSLSYYGPILLQRLLVEIGYQVTISRQFKPDQKVEDLYMIEKLPTTPELPSTTGSKEE